jgi:hypothetical protein
VNFVVEQRGVDVVLRIYTADGNLYDRVDSANGTEGDAPTSVEELNFQKAPYSRNCLMVWGCFE